MSKFFESIDSMLAGSDVGYGPGVEEKRQHLFDVPDSRSRKITYFSWAQRTV